MADPKKDEKAKDAPNVGGQEADVPNPGVKVTPQATPDPYAEVPTKEATQAVHQGFKDTGSVPLPLGHKLNDPGTIPRSPGEWPTGANPPENPLGRSVPGPDRPASEQPHVAAEKHEEAKLINEEAKKKGVSPLHPDIDHDKLKSQAATNVANRTDKDKK